MLNQHYRVSFLTFCLLTLGAQMKAHAQEDSVDELLNMELEQLLQIKVVTASRAQQNIQDAPAVMSVITRDDILRYGGNNLMDVLKHFPGFVPVGDKAFGMHGTMLRGDTNTSGERILTLLDGQPYRSMQTAQDSTSALYRSFPLAAVERIELIRGPGSVIYGTNAVTGVINIITRRNSRRNDVANAPTIEAGLQSGSWDTRKQTIFAAGEKNGWATNLTLENYRTDGWPIGDDLTNIAPTTPFSNISVDRAVMHGSLEKSGFHLNTFIVNYETVFPGFGAEENETNQRYWNLGYENSLASWSYAVNMSTLIIQNELTEEEDKNHMMDFSMAAELIDGLLLTAGGSVSKADNKAVLSNIDTRETNYGIYTQLNYELNSKWTGVTGVQWNKVAAGASDISPRAGLIYHHNEYQGMKILYNEAFRSPTISETDVKFYLPGPLLVVSGNPELSDETVKTLDFQWFNYGQKNLYSLGAFYSRYQERVYQLPFGALYPLSPVTYLNGEDLDIWGLEAEGKFKFGRRDSLDLGWTWQQNQTESGAFNTTLAPTWIANIGYNHDFENGIVASIFNQHVSEFGDNNSPTLTPNPDSESYDLLSVNISVPLKVMIPQTAGLNARVVFLFQNVLDQDVWQPETANNARNTYQTEYGHALYATLEMRW